VRKEKKCVFASLLLAVAYEAISINSNQLAINIDCFNRNSLIDASQRQSLYYAEDSMVVKKGE